MAVRKILQVGNLLLYERSKVVDFRSDDVKAIILDLKDTLEDFMDRKKLGRGISCPQIGLLKRAIYIIEDGMHLAFVNPRIVKRSREKMMVWDSCFCYDVDIFVHIERNRDIEVEYQTPEGVRKMEKFSGPLSELLQHEVDHLNGILSYQHLKKPMRIMKRVEWEKQGRPYITQGWKK
ncbi:MAG: peptide deformylase [Candidatus Altiarchaeales archaeon]|nr:peptide deformylase [Candidatus Altiarchaeales archaeon]